MPNVLRNRLLLFNGGVSNGPSPIVYDEDAQLYFDTVYDNATTYGMPASQAELNTAWKSKLNTWFLAAKSSGNFTEYVRYHSLYNQHIIAARTSLINPTQAMCTINDATNEFRAFNFLRTGVNGNGDVTQGYIATGFTPSVNGGSLYTLNSGFEGFGVANNVAGLFWDMGGTDGAQLSYIVSDLGGTYYGTLNNPQAGNDTTVANGSGLDANYCVIRNTNDLTIYKDNVSTLGTSTPQGLPTVEQYVGAYNNNGVAAYFKIADYSWFAYGSGNVDVAAHNTAQNTLVSGFKNAWFYGNSITVGSMGAAYTSQGWASQVCANKGWKEQNEAISSTCLQNAVPVDPQTPTNFYDRRSSIRTYSASEDAVLFISCYEVNDTGFNWATYTTANYESQLDAILTEAISVKGWPASKIVTSTGNYVVSPNGWNSYVPLGIPAAADNTRYAAFRSSNQSRASVAGITHLCDHYDNMVNNGGAALIDDFIHPKVSGYRVMADYQLSLITDLT